MSAPSTVAIKPTPPTSWVLKPVPPTSYVLKPVPPSTTLSPTAPVGPVITAAPCCWCKVFSKKVSVHGSKYVLSTQHPNHAVQYHLKIDLIAGIVTISRVLGWGVVEPAVTKSEKAAIKAGLIGAVPTLLSNKFSLEVRDDSCQPKTKTLQIRFRLDWQSSKTGPADLKVNLVAGSHISSADGGEMNLDAMDTEENHYTLAHEFMHTIGQVDEYLYNGTAAQSASYKRADGTSKTFPIPSAASNMMKDFASMVLFRRFFWFVEIEAQELLRSGAGLGKANIRCRIV